MFVTKASSCSPSPPRAHREGSGSLSQPLAQLCLFAQAGAALMNSPHLPASPFISPLLLVGVYLFQLCSHGSQSLGGLLQPPPARPAAHGEPSAQPSPSGRTFPPGCAEAQSTGTAFGPTELLAGGCPCHWPSTSKAAAQEALAATYLAAQCNLITNLEALQQSIKSQPIAVV